MRDAGRVVDRGMSDERSGSRTHSGLTCHLSRFTHHVSPSTFLQFALYKPAGLAKLRISNEEFMRNIFPFLATLVIAGALCLRLRQRGKETRARHEQHG